MTQADVIALIFVSWLVILIINSLFIMNFTRKIDKYWSIKPEHESEFLYLQYSRFHRYGYYLIFKRWSLKTVPSTIKAWVISSFVANAITVFFFIALGAILKLNGRL
jgi:ABC-type multidrug transport system permease subunit